MEFPQACPKDQNRGATSNRELVEYRLEERETKRKTVPRKDTTLKEN